MCLITYLKKEQQNKSTNLRNNQYVAKPGTYQYQLQQHNIQLIIRQFNAQAQFTSYMVNLLTWSRRHCCFS